MSFRPKDLNQIIDIVIDNSLKQKGFYEVRLIKDWDQIIGNHYAKTTIPIKIVSTNGQAILHILVKNPAIIVEINHLQDIMLEKIATYFGYKAITGIKLITEKI